MAKINITATGEYLDLEDLPHNCIFNKVKTGCGGTTIALRNAENYVIAVPYTELIVNKTHRSDAGAAEVNFPIGDSEVTRNVFGLFGPFGDCKEALVDYINGEGVKKIICTYDKLPLLTSHLNPEDYRLLIDEYHQILLAYDYREQAIDGVLENFRKFKSFCFMSATPIEADFAPECLNDVEVVTAKWDTKEHLKIYLYETGKPLATAANIIKNYKANGYIELNGTKSYEAFFFINSVTSIASILNQCNLQPDEVRIICADNAKNRKNLEGYNIEDSHSESKTFTFLTSKSFEGADYFSPTGLAFVISEGYNSNTMLSIETQIHQIAGRLRDSFFKKTIIHITSKNFGSYFAIPYHQFLQKQKLETRAAKHFIDNYNKQPSDEREVLQNTFNKREKYIRYDEQNHMCVFKDITTKIDRYHYRTINLFYRNVFTLKSNYMKYGSDIVCAAHLANKNDEIDKICHLPSFEEAYLKYSEYKHKVTFCDLNTQEIKELLEMQPLVADAYSKLGDKKVKQLKYNKKKIDTALKAADETKNIDNRIAEILAEKVKPGFITSAQLKKILYEAYEAVGKDPCSAASKISTWYSAEPTSQYINKKTTRGYMIVSPKFIIDADTE